MLVNHRRPLKLVVALAVALAVAACGSDESDVPVAAAPPTEAATTAGAVATTGGGDQDQGVFPVSVAGDNGEVTLAEAPHRIVSLAPSLTEMLFAIGAGPQVAAVDDQSNYPPEAPTTDLSGYQPNVEAIAAYDPDLVVASGDAGDLVAALTAIDVPVLVLGAPPTLEGVYDQIERLGAATGRVADAAALVVGMQADIDAVVAQVPLREAPLTYYHELDPTYFTVTSSTFIGHVYGLLGLANIADAAEGAVQSGGYPQLTAEYIVAADPDLIFLADTRCCGQSAETVAARPGWGSITAVTTNGVVALDDDIASRWGPRVVDFITVVAERVGVPDAGSSPAGGTTTAP
jgi:iron complex transport system substrate-binding protein